MQTPKAICEIKYNKLKPLRFHSTTMQPNSMHSPDPT
jgi:hypothetical protein